jgi:hypothetical protein
MGIYDCLHYIITHYTVQGVLHNYFMVSMFGWPDPNTRECCESYEKRAKHEPKASEYASFS